MQLLISKLDLAQNKDSGLRARSGSIKKPQVRRRGIMHNWLTKRRNKKLRMISLR